MRDCNGRGRGKYTAQGVKPGGESVGWREAGKAAPGGRDCRGEDTPTRNRKILWRRQELRDMVHERGWMETAKGYRNEGG